MNNAIASAQTATETLQPPGCGVLTISTSVANPAKLFAKYFGKAAYTPPDGKSKPWSPQKAPTHVPLIIGYPCDTGSGIVRGSAYGPLRIRESLYKKKPKLAEGDFGDIPIIPNLLHDSMLSHEQITKSAAYLFAKNSKLQIASPLNLLEETLCELLTKHPNCKTLVLGGDHSMSGAVIRAYKRVGRTSKMALLQIDAHTDLMEERFGVEHCFATWSAHASKQLDHPKGFVQVGVRSSRHNKAHWESKFGITQFWANEIRNKSATSFAKKLLSHWESLKLDKLYISNDIDGTDMSEAPSTGTPEPKGLKSDWVCELLEAVSSNIEVIGADLVEVAPVLGSSFDQKRTIKSATEQILSIQF